MYAHRCHAVARKKVPEFYPAGEIGRVFDATRTRTARLRRICAERSSAAWPRSRRPRRRHDLVGAKAANASNWSVAGPPPQ
jgi:hypothetical protein